MELLARGAARLGITLSQFQLEMFETFFAELVQWNRRVNLTAITRYEEVQAKHFLDSLTLVLALGRERLDSGLHMIDVGSGAGLPGVPLRIAFPSITMVLLESTGKKARFLEHVVGRLGLERLEVVVGRAEEVAHQPAWREGFHAVVSRAVASLPSLAELTLPLCLVGGSVVAMKKGDISEEVHASGRALAVLGAGVPRLVGVTGFEDLGLGSDRVLVVMDKVAHTPDEYPRRPGMPIKRPIAGHD